jgi:hypothetical protein
VTIYLETSQEHFPGWSPFVLALLRLGVRIGEAYALQWGVFDLEARSTGAKQTLYGPREVMAELAGG